MWEYEYPLALCFWLGARLTVHHAFYASWLHNRLYMVQLCKCLFCPMSNELWALLYLRCLKIFLCSLVLQLSRKYAYTCVCSRHIYVAAVKDVYIVDYSHMPISNGHCLEPLPLAPYFKCVPPCLPFSLYCVPRDPPHRLLSHQL